MERSDQNINNVSNGLITKENNNAHNSSLIYYNSINAGQNGSNHNESYSQKITEFEERKAKSLFTTPINNKTKTIDFSSKQHLAASNL